MVRPSPSTRVITPVRAAPKRNPTFPTAKTNPISPAFRCSDRTMNSTSTATHMDENRLAVAVQMAMGRSRGWPST
jgi:hypothetical protein